MSDLITRRLLVIAAVWAVLVSIGTTSGSVGAAGAIGSVVGTFVGSVLLMSFLKLLYQKASNLRASPEA